MGSLCSEYVLLGFVSGAIGLVGELDLGSFIFVKYFVIYQAKIIELC